MVADYQAKRKRNSDCCFEIVTCEYFSKGDKGNKKRAPILNLRAPVAVLKAESAEKLSSYDWLSPMIITWVNKKHATTIRRQVPLLKAAINGSILKDKICGGIEYCHLALEVVEAQWCLGSTGDGARGAAVEVASANCTPDFRAKAADQTANIV